MNRLGGARCLALGVLTSLSAACVHRPDWDDRPGLAARVSGAGYDDPAVGGPRRDDHAPFDPAVKPTAAGPSEGEDQEAASTDPPPAEIPPPGSLNLEAARSLSLQHNPVLAQARADVDAAGADLEITDSAFLPTLQGNYGFQAFSSQVGFVGNRGRFPVLPVRGFGPGTQDFNVTEAQLKWTIFQFGKQIARHGQSALKEEIAKLQLDRAIQTTIHDVEQAYFQALEARAALEIAEKSVERAEEAVKESADFLKRGAITREEHLRAEALLAAEKQARIDARSVEGVAVAGLNRAIGINVNAPTRVAERRETPRLDLPLMQALGLAASSRREIAVVVRGIRIAEEGVSVARAGFLPSVSIQAGYSNVTGTGVQNSNVGAGGIFVTQELYAGGRRRGEMKAAHAAVRTAMAQAQQICDGIAYEVNVAFHGIEDAKERIESSRATFEQASENLRLVTSRYREGDATSAELIAAQAAETAAQQTYNSSLYQYQRALSQMGYAVGGPLPLGPGEAPRPAEAKEEPGAREEKGEPKGEEIPEGSRPLLAPFPTLPPSPGLGEYPRATPTMPAPLPPTPPPGTSSPFRQPSLSRPPYETDSPIGNRP